MSRLFDLIRMRPIKAVFVKVIIPIGDVALVPMTILAALLLKLIRRVGVYRMKISMAIFKSVGVFPIRDHYYEPMFNPRWLRHSLHDDRCLPGIDMNEEGQLDLLGQFHFGEELKSFPRHSKSRLEYHYFNNNFGPGDAEYLYSLIRLRKPATVLEIGSGFSTLMARNAVRTNQIEDSTYRCRHICIEPYEMPWLEELQEVAILRQPVETVDREIFSGLGRNDILFIDSSHVIRPQGDIVVEYLEILPLLQPGVLVHIHDIFTPQDYPPEWVIDEVRLYNEQYLLEAFLSFNERFKVVGALNFLKHHHPKQLADKCPVIGEDIDGRGVSSIWLLRV